MKLTTNVALRFFSLFARANLLVGMLSMSQGVALASEERLSPYEIIDKADASAWRRIDNENTLYIEFIQGRVVIELAPTFAPNHVKNTKALAREGFYDGLSIYRLVDGFVAQGGAQNTHKEIRNAKRTLVSERFRKGGKDIGFTALGDFDGYAAQTGFVDSFAAARNEAGSESWLVHCPGAFAMARGDDPDSGGTEFNIILGHAPRYLDRNVTVFGRVVDGMDVLQKLNRGKSSYGTIEPERHNPILSMKVAADLPTKEQIPIEVMKTDSKAFRQLIASRRNRPESWFIETPNYIDVCGIKIPTRTIKQ